MTPINLRAAEARELLDAGRCEVVRVMKEQPRRVLNGELFWDVGGYRLRGEMAYPKSLPTPGSVVACREPWAYIDAWDDEKGDFREHEDRLKYRADCETSHPDPKDKNCLFAPASTMLSWAIRLHARVESRGAEVRYGKWCWVAWLVREEGGE